MVGCLIIVLLGLLGPTPGRFSPSTALLESPPIPTQVPSGIRPSLLEEIPCAISARYPQAIQKWCAQITHHAHQDGLDPNLVAAVMLLESGGDPLAYSRSGAVGLLQVMPRDGLAANFQCPNGPCFAGRPSIQELQDPEFNLAYGTRMLADLQDQTGSWRDALMAYGPMDVGYTYADTVLSFMERYNP